MLVHLGCGSNYLDGWLNVDFFEASTSDTHRGSNIKPDIWENILEPARFLRQNEVTIFFSSHVLEHFYCHEGVKLLMRLYDYLKPGGFLILETPNLDRVAMLHVMSKVLPSLKAKKKVAKMDLFKADNHNSHTEGPSIQDCLNMLHQMTNKYSAQFYGASWEINEIGYPYHKFVWSKRQLIDTATMVGYELYFYTSATSSHAPIRDMAIIFRKPGKLNNIDQEKADGIISRFYGTQLSRAYKIVYATIRFFFQ